VCTCRHLKIKIETAVRCRGVVGREVGVKCCGLEKEESLLQNSHKKGKQMIMIVKAPGSQVSSLVAPAEMRGGGRGESRDEGMRERGEWREKGVRLKAT